MSTLRFALTIVVLILLGLFVQEIDAQAHTISTAQCRAYAQTHVLVTGKPSSRHRALTACRRAAAIHKLSHPLPNLPFVLVAISSCESGGGVLGRFSYTAENPISTASGRYQYLDTTWGTTAGYRHAADAPPRVQDERAVRDIARGTSPWAASQSCWSQWVAPY